MDSFKEENVTNNFIGRIERLNNRFVLLSLLDELEQCLNCNKLSEVEYTKVAKSLLKHISAPLFGQLTTNEFTTHMSKLFLHKKYASETLALYIHVISEINQTNVYQCSKIIELLELILKDLLTYKFLQNTENNFQTKMKESMLSETICSFSDRLFNYFGSDASKNFVFCKSVIEIYEANILQAIQNFLLNSDTTNRNLSFCAKLIAGYAFISQTFVISLTKWLIEEQSLSVSFVSLLLHDDVDVKKQERLALSIFSLLQDGYQLTKIFGDSVCHNTMLKRLFTRRLLIEQISPFAAALSSLASSLNPSRPTDAQTLKLRASCKIAQYLKQLGDTALTLDTFRLLVSIFSSQSRFLNIVGFDQQLQVGTAIIDMAKVLDESHISTLREEVTMQFASLVPEYIKLPDNYRRQIGMFVTQFVMNLFASEKKKNQLEFEFSDDVILSELRKIAVEDVFNTNSFQSAQSQNAMTLHDDKQIPKSKPIRRCVDMRTQILDSDDDDESAGDDKNLEAELLEYESQEQNCPHYIQDCLERLSSEKENFKDFAVALRKLPKLVRVRAIGFENLALDIFDRMLCLENRFQLPNFQELRTLVVTLVLAYRPDIVGHSVRVLFSRECSMVTRFFILSCLDDAAAFLAGEKSLDESDIKNNSTNDAMNDMNAVTESQIVVKKIGKVTRRATTTASQKERKNRFSDLFPQFIYPLLNVTKVGEHLDLYDRDSILLGKVLSSIGQMIIYAWSSPHVPRVISFTLMMLRPLRCHPQTFIVSGCLYCYAAISDVPMAADCFNAELNDAVEWVSTLVEANETQISAADPLYRETLLVTFMKLKKTLFGDDSCLVDESRKI